MEQSFSNPDNKKIYKNRRLWGNIIIPIASTVILGSIALFTHYDNMRFSEINSRKAIYNYETQNSSVGSKENIEIENKSTSNTNNFTYLKYDPIKTSVETYVTDIKQNGIGILTGGPVLINNIYLPGGANPDRGSIVMLLPENNKSTIYTFNKLVADNWFGFYSVNEINEFNLQYIINERIDLMKKSPNGTSGLGCKRIDVLVLSGQNNLFNKSYQF